MQIYVGMRATRPTEGFMIKEGYKETEIGVIPVGWEVVKLGHVLTIQRGASPRPINEFITKNANGVNWIKIGDIQKNAKYIVKTKQKITDDGAKKSRAIQPKDFVLSNSMSFGRPYISKIYGCIHDGWLLLRNKNENNLYNGFLYEILSSDLAKKQFKRFAAGSTVNNLKSETVSTLKIPLPPLKEQQKIADILSTADNKIDAITKQIEKAEILKKGLLQKLLSEGIGHSEELKDICSSIIGGGTPNTKIDDYWKNGTIPWATVKDMNNKKYLESTEDFITQNGLENSSANLIPKNSIITATRMGIGRFFINKVDMAINQDLKALIIKKEFDKNFIFWSLVSKSKELELMGTGTTVKGIRLEEFKKIKFFIPPLKEQNQIAQILSTADKKLEILRAKKEKYETLKKGLLQKLLSGEIVSFSIENHRNHKSIENDYQSMIQ